MIQDKNLLIAVKALIIILCLFLVVVISNKIKEGKYIGYDIESNVITVTETEEVFSKPDLGIISFSVITEKKTVNDAMAENTESMNNIIVAMKDMGVEDKDLKTTSFYITPRYEWYEGGVYMKGERILVGYEITQTLQVKIRDLDSTGDIIQKAADNGANQTGSLQFTIENEDEVREEARNNAIKKAKVKAKKLAKSLGVSLGRIVNFYESGYVPRYDYYGKGGMDMMEATSPNIEIGENEVAVTVSITYEIR